MFQLGPLDFQAVRRGHPISLSVPQSYPFRGQSLLSWLDKLQRWDRRYEPHPCPRRLERGRLRIRRGTRDFIAKDLGSSPLLAIDPVCSPGSQSLPITEPLFAHRYKWGDVNGAKSSQVRPAPKPSLRTAGLWESIEVTGRRAQELTSEAPPTPPSPSLQGQWPPAPLRPQCLLLRSWEPRKPCELLGFSLRAGPPRDRHFLSGAGTRPAGALASLPGKETQVQRGHLFLQETQAKPGHQGRGACTFGRAASAGGQTCWLWRHLPLVR